MSCPADVREVKCNKRKRDESPTLKKFINKKQLVIDLTLENDIEFKKEIDDKKPLLKDEEDNNKSLPVEKKDIKPLLPGEKGVTKPSVPEIYNGNRYKDTSMRRKKRKKNKNPNVQVGHNKTYSRSVNSREKYLPQVTLNVFSSFDEQARSMVDQLCLRTELCRSTIFQVLRHVEDTFRSVLPGVKALLFGSVRAGIAFKTSDLDVCLCSDARTPSSQFIKKYGTLMYRNHNFRNTFVVRHAKVPIVTTTHKSGFDLDISASSTNGLTSSILIEYLVNSDERVKLLMMLILYWAKKNELCSKPHLFPSYSFVLLVIFYLQQIDPPIFPPLSQIQPNINSRPGIVRDNTFLRTRVNRSTLSDLFKGFFYYYHCFDYEHSVISLYLGRPIPVHDLDPLINMTTDELKIYKEFVLKKHHAEFKLPCIRLQDPIEHNANVTKRVQLKLLTHFKVLLDEFLCEISPLPTNEWLLKII